jgi:hypothetical protein
MIKKILHLIMGGLSLEEALEILLEAGPTEAHQHIGRLKQALRKLVSLSPRGFETTIRGTPTSRQTQRAKEANGTLDKVKAYWLPFRARHLDELKEDAKKKTEFTSMCDLTDDLGQSLVNSNVNDTLVGEVIKIMEACGSLRELADQ